MFNEIITYFQILLEDSFYSPSTTLGFCFVVFVIVGGGSEQKIANYKLYCGIYF